MSDLKIVEHFPCWSACDFSEEVAREYSQFSRLAFENSYQYQANFALHLTDIISKGGNILEVGCGPGWLGIAIRKLCDQVKITLTDHSSQMIQVAKENVAMESLKGFDFSVQDATDLKLPSNSYDLVVSQFMLRHIPEPKKAVYEAYRVLRPGGMLYFTDVVAIDNEEKKAIIAKAPGVHGPLFIQAAIDSALTREHLHEIASTCGTSHWHLGFGGLGGFKFPGREILDVVKKGFPLRQLELQARKSEWSHSIAPYWCHLYIYKE
jgi:ubiquinone/menaquinone biosynthesis C-methylase UbiE